MKEAERYRKFAQECLRMAKAASAADKAVLLKIAEAWEAQAKAAERKAGNADD
jgi:hypothetical protein